MAAGLLIVLASCTDSGARPLPTEEVTTSRQAGTTMSQTVTTSLPAVVTTLRPAPVAAVPTRPTPRTIEIAEVSLRAGEWFALGVHPDAPRCVPVRASASVALPATDGNWHLFFAVRALAATNTTFTMSYVAQDPFFYYRPIELAVGAASPSVRFTGARTGDVTIYVRDIDAYRVVLATSSATVVRDLVGLADDLPIGELVADDRATLAIINTGRASARPSLYAEWPIAAA